MSLDHGERQRLIDEEHLKLLRWGYFISAAMTGVFSLMGVGYAAMGLMVAKMPFKEGEAPPEGFAWIFIGAGLFVTTWMLALMAAKLYVAKALRERTARTFCYVVAVICLLGIPYGTLLGVLTLMVLSRPSVEALFASTQTSLATLQNDATGGRST